MRLACLIRPRIFAMHILTFLILFRRSNLQHYTKSELSAMILRFLTDCNNLYGKLIALSKAEYILEF